MMASLAVASQSSVSFTEIVRLKPNEETSPALNGAPSGSATVCCRNQPVNGRRRQPGPHPVIVPGDAPERCRVVFHTSI
jgi:hypothetical protein